MKQSTMNGILGLVDKEITEMEKKIEAQIEEYAAKNLPLVIDIDQLTGEFLRENFYKHPTLALVYFHCCSVDPRASIWNDELKKVLTTQELGIVFLI